ncbi:unnamed protein product [Cuscuta epithymum]|uniref:Uncharacterized protein n=1 Tax=Cuscuta epithymum TaxID=186058 RepID=A0AAV0FTH4_9ASTE|nr:unnamed protein product [Cuscuta epithymum]
MGEGVCSAGGGSGCTCGSARVHPDTIQHAAGHHAVCVPDGVQQRPEGGFGPGEVSLPHHSDSKGCVGACVGGDVPEEPPWRAEHGAPPAHRGALAAPVCAGDAGPGHKASSRLRTGK